MSGCIRVSGLDGGRIEVTAVKNTDRVPVLVVTGGRLSVVLDPYAAGELAAFLVGWLRCEGLPSLGCEVIGGYVPPLFGEGPRP